MIAFASAYLKNKCLITSQKIMTVFQPYPTGHDLFHGFRRNELEIAVEIMTAGKKIGAGQAHEGEAGAVCAATDGLNDGCDTAVDHCLFCQVNDFHMGFNLGEHIIILISQFQLDAIVVFFVLLINNSLNEGFSVFKGSFVEITDDIVQFGISRCAFERT